MTNRAINWLLGLTLCLGMGPAMSQDNSPLKLDTPKLDQVPEKVPLKGKIQHNNSLNPLPGFIQGGGGNLRGSARGTQGRGSLNGQLNHPEPSGIGIIGVKFVLYAGKSPIINRVFPLTPAFQSGLRPEDVIVAVDGVPTFGLSKEEVYDMIVGRPGTTVTLSVMRSGDFQAHTMTRMDLNDISDPFIRRDYMMAM